ncbi:unnamed protein product [Paramecium sonneborni]|uniref:Uncharacterized protein n=1 Tax=Paramecium sonneborni TaxID=65129 RepID=A0A8S1RQI5_9CILI|nr:unnamed protein product [Paramecium sonneborni]
MKLLREPYPSELRIFRLWIEGMKKMLKKRIEEYGQKDIEILKGQDKLKYNNGDLNQQRFSNMMCRAHSKKWMNENHLRDYISTWHSKCIE